MKYKGKDLSLTFDGDETNLEGTEAVMDSEDADSDAITFGELGEGTPSQWFFQITAVSDYGAGSFWSLVWDNAGLTIPFVFRPYGNATPSPAQPHFTGTCSFLKKPPAGGQAGEVFTFETRADIDGTPTRVTA